MQMNLLDRIIDEIRESKKNKKIDILDHPRIKSQQTTQPSNYTGNIIYLNSADLINAATGAISADNDGSGVSENQEKKIDLIACARGVKKICSNTIIPENTTNSYISSSTPRARKLLSQENGACQVICFCWDQNPGGD